MTVLIASCGADPAAPLEPEPQPNEPAPRPADPGDTEIRSVDRPVQPMALEVASYALPGGFRADATLSVEVLGGAGTLVGGESGLYLLGTEGLELVDATPVRGLSRSGSAIVVGRADGLFLWSGALETSPLTEALEDPSVTATAENAEGLWIATPTELYVFGEDRLSAFTELGGATRIAATLAAPEILLSRGGTIEALRMDGAGYVREVLSDELDLSDAVPAGLGRVVALSEGEVVERVSNGDGTVTWSRLAFDLGAGAPLTVEALASDPSDGAVWAATNQAILRVEADVAARVERPALGAVVAMDVSADGAVWLSDGLALVRLGGDSGPVTYARDIAAFSEANCQRCHAELGVAFTLETYSAWEQNVDLIIEVLENGRMPLDRRPLVGGTVELVKEWKQGGLVE